MENGTRWLKEVGWVEKSITALKLPLGERNKLSNGSPGKKKEWKKEIKKLRQFHSLEQKPTECLLSEWVWGQRDFIIAVFDDYIYASTSGFLSLAISI